MENAQGSCDTKGCKCPCHRMMGILIALIGVVFLLGEFGMLTPHWVSILWPILLILIGLKKAFKGMCKCCSKA